MVNRCEECGRQWDADEDDWICPLCRKRHDDAIDQTKEMPPPRLEDRPWSTSWMKDRLGVNGRVDE